VLELNGPKAKTLVDAKTPKVGMHTLTLEKNKVGGPGQGRRGRAPGRGGGGWEAVGWRGAFDGVLFAADKIGCPAFPFVT
jgi:hypothetical protein